MSLRKFSRVHYYPNLNFRFTDDLRADRLVRSVRLLEKSPQAISLSSSSEACLVTLVGIFREQRGQMRRIVGNHIRGLRHLVGD